MGASERRKGHDFERWVVRLFNESFSGIEARRGLQYQSGVGMVPDVRAGPMWIECKRGARVNIKGALRQAMSDCAPGFFPTVVSKDDKEPVLITMELTDFIELLHEADNIVRGSQ